MDYAVQINGDGGGILPLPTKLTSKIRASHNFKGETFSCTSDVEYVFELRERPLEVVPTSYESVNNRKMVDAGANHLPMNVKSQVSNLVVPSMRYDLRALCFALGTCMGGLAGMRDPPQVTGTALFLSAGAAGMSEHSLLVALPQGESPTIVYMLNLLTGMCNLPHYYVASDTIAVAERPRNQREWAKYIKCIFTYLMCDAIENGSGAEHLTAIVRGMYNSLTLRAHSDEGGWVRQLLRTVEYPRPCGYLDTRPNNTMLNKLFGNTRQMEARNQEVVFKLMLTAGALVMEADPKLKENGVLTLLRNERVTNYIKEHERDPRPDATLGASSGLSASTESRAPYKNEFGVFDVPAGLPIPRDLCTPSSCPGLAAAARKIVNNITHGLGTIFLSAGEGFLCSSLDREEYLFLENNKPDTHLSKPVIFPYLFIESGPIIAHPAYKISQGPSIMGETSMPLFPNIGCVRSMPGPNDCTSDGYVMAKNTYLCLSDTSLRSMGAFYLASARCTGDDTLLRGCTLLGPRDRFGNARPSFVSTVEGEQDTPLNKAGWWRPHCAIPAPCEMAVVSHTAVLEIAPRTGGPIRVSDDALKQPVMVSCTSPIAQRGGLVEDSVECVINREVSEGYLLTTGQDDRLRIEDERLDVLAHFASLGRVYNRPNESTLGAGGGYTALAPEQERTMGEGPVNDLQPVLAAEAAERRGREIVDTQVGKDATYKLDRVEKIVSKTGVAAPTTNARAIPPNTDQPNATTEARGAAEPDLSAVEGWGVGGPV